MTKKVDLYYVCDKEWNTMDVVNDKTKLCQKCNECINKYSGEGIIDLKEDKCAFFSLNQINSFKRNITFKNTSILQMTLLTLLGMTYEKKVEGNTLHQTELKIDNFSQKNKRKNILKISGIVTVKDKNIPLEDAIITIKKESKIIKVLYTDSLGKFNFDIDIKKTNLTELKIEFSHVGFKSFELNKKIKSGDNKNIDINIALEVGVDIDLFEIVHFDMGGLISRPTEERTIKMPVPKINRELKTNF